MDKNVYKAINWTVLVPLILIGFIILVNAFLDLSGTTQSFDDAQSRAEFRWSSNHTLLTVGVIFFSTLLALGWKRIFPFNVPLALIIAGFCYELVFFTFTVGWVGIVGLLGLGIAIVVGVILMMLYSVFLFIERRKKPIQ
ncbi:MAG TPA: RND transporter [Bacillales bacterium]|nr:RND transporter [Bacillales bacterium]